MSVVLEQPRRRERTVADLLRELGNIPPHRVLLNPPPGEATEADMLRNLEGEPKVLCELVQGTLVEKPMGFQESRIAARLIQLLLNYLDQNDLGFISAPDGPFRLDQRLYRVPDVAFVSWHHYPSREAASQGKSCPMPPDLAVEILSESNSEEEMDEKTKEYLKSGGHSVWIIDPETRTAMVRVKDRPAQHIEADGFLEVPELLPGLRIELARLFR